MVGGERRFVPVDELPGKGRVRRLGRLRAAMRSAVALREDGGLKFVVAPLRAGDGDVVPERSTGSTDSECAAVTTTRKALSAASSGRGPRVPNGRMAEPWRWLFGSRSTGRASCAECCC